MSRYFIFLPVSIQEKTSARIYRETPANETTVGTDFGPPGLAKSVLLVSLA